MIQSKPKRKIVASISTDPIFVLMHFDLIGKKKMFRTIVKFPSLEIEVIDRHIKQPFWNRKAGNCDHWKKCYLSIANSRIFTNKKLGQDLSIEELFVIMEKVWEEDKENI